MDAGTLQKSFTATVEVEEVVVVVVVVVYTDMHHKYTPNMEA